MKIKYLLILLMLGMGGQLKAQSITVTETNKKQTVPLDGSYAVVDINADLKINIQKTALTSALASNIHSSPEVNAQLILLNKLLKSQTRILELLNPKIARATTTTAKSQRREYYQLMVDFYTDLQSNPTLRARVNDLYKQYFDKTHLIDTVLNPYVQTYVIRNLSGITDDLVATLQHTTDLSKLNIQVTAVLKGGGQSSNKVHITNFDTYSEGVFYEVPQWVTTFSPEDIKKFDEAKQQAGVLNSLINQNFKDIKEVLTKQLTCIDCFKDLLKDAQGLINDKQTIFTGQLTVAGTYLDGLKTQLISLSDAIDDLNEFNKDPNKNILDQFNNVSGQFLALAKGFPTTVKGLTAALPAVLKANARITAFQTKLDGCIIKLNQDAALVSNMAQVAAGLLSPFKQTADAAENIKGDVLNHTIDEIPATGFIDLKTTGKRSNGDDLVISVLYNTPENVQNKVAGQTLEQYHIKIQQVEFYSESFVSVVGIRPLQQNSDVKLGGRIQFAPSGSLLLKFGSRTSPLWNALNPGIGVNLTAPDFDLDGSPEIAYGGVVSLFRNILSAGLGYNTKTSSTYWFFGLSLPFASIIPFGQPKTN